MQIEGRKGKGGGGRTPVEATDTLRSVAVAEVLDLVSEGPIQGLVNGLKSVYLDGVALQNADGSMNFEDVQFAYNLGTQGQAALHGFDLVSNEVAVGLRVNNGTPLVRTVLAGPDTVRVTVGIPQLSLQDLENGDMVGNKVEYSIELQSNGGGFVEVYRTTIDGKTMSRYQRSTLVTLTGSAPWDIRVKRITADATQSNSVNAIWWDSYTEIQTARLRYPNSAMHGLRVNAQHFGRVPVRGYDLLGRVVQVPANYNPITRAYTGVWNGTFVPAWTNNPAWVFYDLVTHPRYGLGQYVQASAVNKWRLYQIAQYCDELVPDGRGGQEPRFTCNLYLQEPAEALRVLQDLVAIFRGILLYSAGTVDVVQDAPTDALSLFTPANVIDGKFVYQGASERTRHSGVIVYWNNLANQGKREPELYQEPDLVARYGVRNLELSPLGTWSRGQAVRLAKWALYSEDAESEVVNFSVGSEGALVPIGRAFKIADPAVAGVRLGGRVRSATTTAVTLDKAVTLAGGQAYTLTLALPDPADPFNLISEKRNVSTAAGATSVVTVSSAFSAAAPAQAIWLLESTEVVAPTWRCIGVREVPGEARYEITGVAHDPAKFARIELGVKLDPKPISVLKPGATKPSGLVLVESPYTSGSVVRSRLTASWVPEAPGQVYRVSWRYRGGVWGVLPDTSAQTVDIPDLLPGLVEVAVRAVNSLGNVSPPLEGFIELGGKTSTGDVAALAISATAVGIVATWAAPTGADGATWTETELRRGASWSAGTVLFKGRLLSHNLGWLTAGTVTVWAVHRDSSGNESAPVSASMTVNAPGQPTVASSVDVSVLRLSWADCKTTQPIARYIVKRGAAYDTATTLGEVNALYTVLLEISPGTHRFWVAAVDTGNNTGAAGSVLVTVESPISEALADLGAGLQDSVDAINDLGAEVHSPVTGLLAADASRRLLGLAVQQTAELTAAADLAQLLLSASQGKLMRDAGIRTDPATGQVSIYGLDQTAQTVSQVQVDLDAVRSRITLEASRITQLHTDLINAALDPSGAPILAGVVTQINAVRIDLDALAAAVTLKASSATVGAHYVELQEAVSTLSAQGEDLLVIASTISSLQTDLTAANSRLLVLENSAQDTTELVAARLGGQAAAEQQDALTLATLLQGINDRTVAAQQLAYAKSQLTASVETLGVSTASQLEVLAAQVAGNRADFDANVTATATALGAEVTARQTLAAKQQTDHNAATALVTSEQSARITGDQAQATALLSLQVSMGNTIASISQRLAVVVDGAGNVVAAYTLALNANGRVVGMRLDNNGTIGNFVVQADKFAFVLPGNNTEKPLFVAGLVNGVNTFGINGQLMVDGTIYARALNVDKLASIVANLGSITAGNLNLESDGSGGYAWVRSGAAKWWYDGQPGWVLARHPNGNTLMEFEGGGGIRLRMSSWGDCELRFPGVVMTPDGLQINQANVINTLNVAGGSITSPAFSSGPTSDLYMAYPLTGVSGEVYQVFISCSWIQSETSNIQMEVDGGVVWVVRPSGGTVCSLGFVVALSPGSHAIRLVSADARNNQLMCIYAIANKR